MISTNGSNGSHASVAKAAIIGSRNSSVIPLSLQEIELVKSSRSSNRTSGWFSWACSLISEKYKVFSMPSSFIKLKLVTSFLCVRHWQMFTFTECHSCRRSRLQIFCKQPPILQECRALADWLHCPWCWKSQLIRSFMNIAKSFQGVLRRYLTSK